jgi:hypothetical protein
VEDKPVGLLGRGTGGGFEVVPLAGDAAHLQPVARLRLQDRAGAEGVAAVERERMIKDVENAGHGPRL